MIHQECLNCKHCAWCANMKGKWICECMRPRFWGVINENGEKCESYQFFSWENDE